MTLPDVRDRQNGFGAGLNTTSDDTALQPNECRVAKNARLSTRGAIEKRGGTQHILTASLGAFPMNGYSWGRTTSVQELVIANGKLYTGTLGIPMTLTDRGGAFATSVPPTFAAFKGPSAEGVYIADGGALNFWDGTTLTENIANTPAVEAITAWGPRLFAVKGDTIYWSSTTAGINGHTLGALAGGGQAIVRTYGGQELIMAYPLKGSLLLFHRQAISRFTGATTDDIAIEAGTQGISGDVGTIAKRSVIGIENSVFFLTDRGAFAATEMSVEPISSPLEQTLANLSKADWAKVSSVHARAFNEVRWSIPGVGVYAFNYRTRGWTGPWDVAYNGDGISLWDTVDSDGRPVVLLGGADGMVSWCDRDGVWRDGVSAIGEGGTPYQWQVQCRRFFGEDYTVFKAWRTMYVLGDFPDPSGVSFTIRSDASAATSPLPFNPSMTGMTQTWGHPSTMWGGNGTAWGGEGAIQIERARVPLHGVYPWVDVTMQYTGDQAGRLSIVDVLGFARNRR